jgi:negative regulator of sigma E activity
MDETLQELENELKRLTPRRPSAGLIAAIEHELGAAAVPAATTASSPVARGWLTWRWMPWAVATAAAVALIAVVQFRRGPASLDESPSDQVASTAPLNPATPADHVSDRYEPVQATSVLYDLKEDGVATLPDRSQGRQVRYRYVDTYTWKNPANNASLRWSVPRDEVRVIRASLD